MKFHIVRNKETLADILYIYNLTKDELVEQNKHIRVWDKLIPGTKLKIPAIPEAVELEVSDIEPFVEDYYPSVNEDIVEKAMKNEEEYKKVLEEIEQNKVEEKHTSSNIYEEYEEIKKPVIENEQDQEEDEGRDCENNLNTPPVITPYPNIPVAPTVPLTPQYNYYNPYYYNVYNPSRYMPYPIIYYPVYYPKKPN